MAKKNKPLLNEGTIRRMMKLADMDVLGDGFISERYTPLEEEDLDEKKKFYGEKAKQRSDTGRGEDYRGVGGKHLGEAEEEMDFEAEEDIEGVEGIDAPEVDVDVDEEPSGEVTISDEEAQCVIDLADRLRSAVGEEDAAPEEEEMEVEMDFEEEDVEEESPGSRSMAYEGVVEDELYEAALKGLNLDLVDDQKEKKAVMMQEVKQRIYQRVISRLLKENKKS
tara:strand:+ start:269 stop:937 length:669 start_codon:yes stop_codon:yes gene_type:complete